MLLIKKHSNCRAETGVGEMKYSGNTSINAAEQHADDFTAITLFIWLVLFDGDILPALISYACNSTSQVC
ncbi:MAG: hypothetical protein PVG45_00435 [Gammaproteobacteria bacterium]|jgi:hypothetical protein